MWHAFIYGAILSFSLIMPLGMQNVFIFNQGANQKHFLHAMPSVVTAILCDSILVICAVLGISLVLLQIPWLKTLLFLVGFIFLLCMGFVTWHSKPMQFQAGKKPLGAKNKSFLQPQSPYSIPMPCWILSE